MFFNLTLRNASPTSISKGGTNLGEALRKAIKAFGPGQTSRMILLITDGEDHDSYPQEVAKVAQEQGVRIVSIGFVGKGEMDYIGIKDFSGTGVTSSSKSG